MSFYTLYFWLIILTDYLLIRVGDPQLPVDILIIKRKVNKWGLKSSQGIFNVRSKATSEH